jgi:hypothetical protein
MDEVEEIFNENQNLETIEDNSSNDGLDRITLKYIFSSVLAVLNFEKGLLFTIKELIIKPRIVIEEYLKRDRKKLVHPIRFLVFSTAFATFLTLYFVHNSQNGSGYIQTNFDEGFNIGMAESDSLLANNITLDSTAIKKRELKLETVQNFSKEFPEMIMQMSDKFTFALILFFSFFTLLFYRKNGYNFTENIVINSYLASISNVFSIVLTTLSILTDNPIFIITASLLGIVFTLYFWTLVFNRKSFGGVLRSILVYAVSYIAFMIILGIGIAIYIFLKFN